MVEAVGINDELAENFECNICKLIVFEPVSCKECDKLFCKACIDQWNKPCPLCNKSFKGVPLHKLLKRFLNDILIKECPLKCGEG
jgi:hypothetical protein